MKKILIVGLVIVILLVGFYYFRNPLGKRAVINGHTITLEFAITSKEKSLGLGNRDTLPLNTGMLFVHQNKDRHGYWMMGMQFPLDFIWIDGNKIVDLSQNIPAPRPGERPMEVSSSVPVDKVLEVNAGVIQELNIKVGDIIQFID